MTSKVFQVFFANFLDCCFFLSFGSTWFLSSWLQSCDFIGRVVLLTSRGLMNLTLICLWFSRLLGASDLVVQLSALLPGANKLWWVTGDSSNAWPPRVLSHWSELRLPLRVLYLYKPNDKMSWVTRFYWLLLFAYPSLWALHSPTLISIYDLRLLFPRSMACVACLPFGPSSDQYPISGSYEFVLKDIYRRFNVHKTDYRVINQPDRVHTYFVSIRYLLPISESSWVILCWWLIWPISVITVRLSGWSWSFWTMKINSQQSLQEARI